VREEDGMRVEFDSKQELTDEEITEQARRMARTRAKVKEINRVGEGE